MNNFNAAQRASAFAFHGSACAQPQPQPKPPEDLPMFSQPKQGIPSNELLAVLMPTRDGQMSIETHLALNSNSGPMPMLNIVESRLPVVEARNSLAQKLLQAKREWQYVLNYALWIDSDAWWPPGTIARMLQIMAQRRDLDMLAASSSDRKPFCSGGQFVMHGGLPMVLIPHGTRAPIGMQSCPRYTPGEVVEIDATSFHFVLMRTSLLERVGPSPFNVPDTGFYAEDMQFCFRAKKAGAKVACDTGSIVAHIDIENGLAFIPNQRPGKVNGNEFGILVDARTDEEILAEWELKNIRANRRYGADVDSMLQRAYEHYISSYRRAALV